MRRFKTKIAGVYGAFSLRAAGVAAAFAEWQGGSPIAACTAKKRDLRSAIAPGGNGCWHLERIGSEDNFFELGGHSLLATQAIARLREAFKSELPLRLLFESPTVASLSDCISLLSSSEQKLEAPPIDRAPRGPELPLSFPQQRLWFVDRLKPGDPAYNIPAAV